MNWNPHLLTLAECNHHLRLVTTNLPCLLPSAGYFSSIILPSYANVYIKNSKTKGQLSLDLTNVLTRKGSIIHHHQPHIDQTTSTTSSPQTKLATTPVIAV